MIPRLMPLLILLLAAPASAAQVRVKSKHPTAKVAGEDITSYKVAAEEVLRGATIGPSSVRVILRRVAPGSAGPIAVKLMRDGREVSRMLVGGTPIDRIEGETALASAPVEKQIDVPGGPHTIYVEVGQGEGEVLVAFEKPITVTPAPLIAKAPPKKKAPRAKKSPDKQAAAPAAEPDDAAAEETDEAAETEPSVEVVRLVEAMGEEKKAEEKKVAAVPDPKPQLEQVALRPRQERRLFVGLRAGGLSQPQVGAAGVAVGLTARWALFEAGASRRVTGPMIGLSADFLRYQASWSVPHSAAMPAYTHELTVTSVPVLAEASWSFSLGPVSPFVGGSLGVSFASVGSTSSVESAASSHALLSAGLHGGVEIPFGTDRLGLELRWLHARTGDGKIARDLQVGGLLAQASWRFGI